MTWHARLQTTDTCRNRGTNNRCLNSLHSLQHRLHRIPTPHPPSYPSSAAPGFKTFPPVLDWTDAETERQAARLHTLTDEMSDLQADFHYVLLPTNNQHRASARLLRLSVRGTSNKEIFRYQPSVNRYSFSVEKLIFQSMFFSMCRRHWHLI